MTQHTHAHKHHSGKPRTIPRGKRLKSDTVRIGHTLHIFDDIYYVLLNLSWRMLILLILASYLLINAGFALVFFWVGGGIESANSNSYLDMFFFSVQTFATIGYGRMAPVGTLVNSIVTVEALVSFAFHALVTCVLFSKFSRPTSQVLFSNMAVITPYNGVPHLMLRIANERHSRIVDADVELALMERVVSDEGYMMRRFHGMRLVRDHVPFLQLSWTIMHPITADSPIYGMNEDMLATSEVEIIVSLTGTDESTFQPIHAHYSYIGDDIAFNATFADVVSRRDDQHLEINYTKFHEIKRGL